MNLKTIDINALQWFDKINGNSYFAATIALNYGYPDQVDLKLPFQYGYGDAYISEAKNELVTLGYINTNNSLSTYCRTNNIILRTNKHENCKKKELKNI